MVITTSAYVCQPTEERTSGIKADIKLLAKLRKETQVSVTKAREALMATGNDYVKALEWIHHDSIKSGAKKAAKVQGRAMDEGVVAVKLDNTSATLVELSCETDFVARNKVFEDLAKTIAEACNREVNSAAAAAAGGNKFEDIAPDRIMSLPVASNLQESVKDMVVREIGKLGENISVRRAATVMSLGEDNLCGAYVHGVTYPGSMVGRVGAIVVLKASSDQAKSQDLQPLARRLAQHVVGFKPLFVTKQELEEAARDGRFDYEEYGEQDVIISPVLLEQEFMFAKEPGAKVAEALGDGVEVVAFKRFERGE
ncbi:Elongation factor Ts, mitochondrial [Spiromyces aspiralis]|uniref:Elongation factor Ts, mitochondrial n=1 Tax=Spiromyces aspiralis TaxID=68401 RepID=A0ACC1HJM6_9FUNG|nr:Elongation factor Ts, mitochondrial [Spiromyces aspiralis]